MRRLVLSSECNEDDVVGRKNVNKESLDGRMQVVGRVLRSKTMSMNGDEKVFDGGKGENVRMIGRPWKRIKGQRGRPPKVKWINGVSLVIGDEKEKVMGSKKNSGNKASEVINVEKEKVTRSKGKSHRPKNQSQRNRLTSHSHQVGRSANGKQLETNKHKKEGEVGRREEKQLVREQIISMLKKAGCTVEYRPRQSREYLDAVYVDPEGRTYWSVTLAYRKLKEKVEDGVADNKTISAFIPIPEEVFQQTF
ncbi:unnamed protein product [Ilex paraguariensis]|uniref:DUF7028 domain-containing protein n=1 Tax=Ilex paraguariensis TaxID=185542 RepID=A0ABC8R512_9AQUA